MRLLIVLLVVGCSDRYHPAVIPKLSEVPSARVDDSISSSLARPDAEHRPATKRNRKIETFAATAAAYLGAIFSTTENVTIGSEWIDVTPSRKHAPAAETKDGEAKEKNESKDTDKHEDKQEHARQPLVPWVKIK